MLHQKIRNDLFQYFFVFTISPLDRQMLESSLGSKHEKNLDDSSIFFKKKKKLWPILFRIRFYVLCSNMEVVTVSGKLSEIWVSG